MEDDGDEEVIFARLASPFLPVRRDGGGGVEQPLETDVAMVALLVCSSPFMFTYDWWLNFSKCVLRL